MIIRHWRNPNVDLNAPKVRDTKGRFASQVSFTEKIMSSRLYKELLLVTWVLVVPWIVGYALSVAPIAHASEHTEVHTLSQACAFAKEHPKQITNPIAVIENCL